MKVLGLVLFFAIAVNNAVSQWRGGVRIDRPPNLPSSSTRQGGRPAGSRPPGSFDSYRGPPPPPRRRDSFDINYFQRRREHFIPVELHPPVLQRPKPTPSPKRKRPKNRKRKGNKSKPWRKNKNEATPPTEEMVTNEYFTTTEAFTTTFDYFTTTTAPTTQKPTTRAPTTQKPTTTPATTTTPTTTPSTQAPTTKVSVNNQQYAVAGAQQPQNKSPETKVSSVSNTNKIPRPPPFTRYRPATPDIAPLSQQNGATTALQEQRVSGGQSTTQTQPSQPNESNIYITRQRTIGGPLQPALSSSVTELGQPNGINGALQQTNSEPYSSKGQYNQPPSSGPALLQTLPSKANGMGLAQNQQQQQTHFGSSQNPNQSSGQISSKSAYEQQVTNAGSSIAGAKLSPSNNINRVKQLNSGQMPSQTLNQPIENYKIQQQLNSGPALSQAQVDQPIENSRLQQQINARPSPQSRLSKSNDMNTTPFYKNARPLGTLSRLDQSTDFNRVDQIQSDTSSNAPNNFDATLYSPQRNRPIEIDFRKPVDPKPLTKPVFRFPQASFRRPSDVPTEIKSKVLSRISTEGPYKPTGPSSVKFSSGSKPLLAGQSTSAKTLSQQSISSNSHGDSRYAINDVSYSLESSKVDAIGVNREPASARQSSSSPLSGISKPYGTGIQQQIVAAPELPINRENRNQINIVYDQPMTEPVTNSGIFDHNSKVSDVRGADMSRKPSIEQLPYSEPTRPIPKQEYSAGSFSSLKNLDMGGSISKEIGSPRLPSVSSIDYAGSHSLGAGKSASFDSQNQQQLYAQAREVLKTIADKRMRQQNPNDVLVANSVNSASHKSISNNEVHAQRQTPRYVPPESNSYKSSAGNNSQLTTLSGIQDSKSVTSESSSSLDGSRFLPQQPFPSNIARLDKVKSGSTNVMGSGEIYAQQQKASFSPAPDTVKSGSIKTMTSDGMFAMQQRPSFVSASGTIQSSSSKSMASDGIYSQQQQSSFVPVSDMVKSGSNNVMANDGIYSQQQTSSYVPSSDIAMSGSSNVMASDGIYSQQQTSSYVPSSDIAMSGPSNVMTSDGTNGQPQTSSYVPSSDIAMSGSSNVMTSDGIYGQPQSPSYASASDKLNTVSSYSMQSAPVSKHRFSETSETGSSNTKPIDQIYPNYARETVQIKGKTGVNSVSNTLLQNLNNAQGAVNPGADSTKTSGNNPQQQKHNLDPEAVNSRQSNALQQKPKYATGASNSGSENVMLSGTYSEQQKPNFATDTSTMGSDSSMQSGAYSERRISNIATDISNFGSGNTNMATDTAILELGKTIKSATYPQSQKPNIATENLNSAMSSDIKSGTFSQPRGSSLTKDTVNSGSSKSVPNPSESKSQQSEPVNMLGTDNINVAPDSSMERGVNPSLQQSGSTRVSNSVDSVTSKSMQTGTQSEQQSALSKDQFKSEKPIVDLNKPSQQSILYPKSSDLPQNKASSTNNNSDKPKTKTFTDTQTLSENTKTSSPSEQTVQTQPAASSSLNTKESRVQKVGMMMLKVFDDFMAKFGGAPSTQSDSKPTKVSQGQQIESKPIGKANSITSSSNSMQNDNVINQAAQATIPKARDEFAIQSTSDQIRVSNVLSNRGTERQVSNGASGPIVGELNPAPSNVQVTNGVQNSAVQDVYPVVNNVAKQGSIGNNSPYETPSSSSNNNIGYQLPSATFQPRPLGNAESKVVSGPPPPSFRRGKPPTARNSALPLNVQPVNEVIGNVNTNQQNTDPLYVPVNAHPPVLTRPPKVYNTQEGSIAPQGSAYPDPAPQGTQEVYNQHQTVGGRLGPAPCKMAPVCASDGFTYMSNCFLWAGLTIVCEGYCPCPAQPAATQPGQQGTLSHLLPYDAGPEVQAPVEPQPLCSSCPSTFSPVCTATGATYDNDCLRRCNGEALACSGECPCPSSASGAQPCENHCQATIAPVCSVWDHTYDNDCLRLCSGEAKACNGECPCPGSHAANGVVAQETAPGYQGNVNNEPSNQPLSTWERKSPVHPTVPANLPILVFQWRR